MYDDDAFEVDPHEFEKARREKRIKGKKQDKGKDQWSDGKGKKPKNKHGGSNRRQSKAALREFAHNYHRRTHAQTFLSAPLFAIWN